MAEDIAAETGSAHTLQKDFEYWSNALDIIEGSIDEYAGTGEVPDEALPNGMQPIWDVRKSLSNSEVVTLANLSQYFELSVRQDAAEARVRGREPRSVAAKFNDLLVIFEKQNLGAIISQESSDGPLHHALLELISERNAADDVISEPLKVLRDLYGFESTVKVLGVSGDEFSDHIRTIMKTPNAMKWSHHVDRTAQGEMKWPEQRKWYREWMTTGLGSYLDIDRDEAYNYVFSAATGHEPENLIDIIEKFDQFKLDQIRNLSSVTGIHGLEAYNTEQLQRMIEFVNEPETVAERLAKHDIVVTLVNRMGDHNGVLKKTAQEVDDPSARVLFFEINNMSDIYRRMVAVSKAGIRPSTLILAAHSNKGQFMVSDDRDPDIRKKDVASVAARRVVQMVNESSDLELNPNGQKGYSMHGMQGMARLVDEFMTPSRAIDDDLADKGRKKIIFSACYAGKEVDVKDLDESGERITIGKDSVVSRLAKDLATTGAKSAVDIYGGPDSIQLHRTTHGLRYSAQPKGLGLEREKLHAVRVRLESGGVTKEEVDEIPMRKAA